MKCKLVEYAGQTRWSSDYDLYYNYKSKIRISYQNAPDAKFWETVKQEVYDAISGSMLSDDQKTLNPPERIKAKAIGIALDKVKDKLAQFKR